MDGTPDSELEVLRSATAGLAAEARDRALEFEGAKQLPDDFVAKLKAAGVYRLLVARSQGGLGGSTRDWLELIIALAESDGSTGWACAHGAICSALLANVANQAFVAEAMADPDISIAWSNLPRIQSARFVPGGMQISGEWAFATGAPQRPFLVACS
jgi:alkylation response protein AidB-like acyl-CoA dehydrogenase